MVIYVTARLRKNSLVPFGDTRLSICPLFQARFFGEVVEWPSLHKWYNISKVNSTVFTLLFPGPCITTRTSPMFPKVLSDHACIPKCLLQHLDYEVTLLMNMVSIEFKFSLIQLHLPESLSLVPGRSYLRV